MKHPIFVHTDEGIQSSINSVPYLIDEGDSIDISFTVIDNSSYIKEILIEDIPEYTNIQEATLHIINVQNPVFITATIMSAANNNLSTTLDSVSRDTTVSSSYNSSFCCGVRSVKLSLQEDGAVIGTVSGLPGDVYSAMRYVMSGVDDANAGDKYTITSWRTEGALLTISAISTVTKAYEKIANSAIFKTIPNDIYNLYISGIIPRSIQNPLDAPDSEIFIRTSDIYGTDGWTVQDILDTLEINAHVPSAFNYHVPQLTVTRGTPIISVLHNLLPIPGLLIERDVRHSNGTVRYSITIAKGRGRFTGTKCKTIGSSTKVTTYKPVVLGQLGEPLYIDAPNPPTIDTPTYACTFSLIKSIFNTDFSESIVHTESVL